jgi:uncharacterized protein DUF4238
MPRFSDVWARSGHGRSSVWQRGADWRGKASRERGTDRRHGRARDSRNGEPSRHDHLPTIGRSVLSGRRRTDTPSGPRQAPYPWTMAYPKVERAHVVPRCYLKQFAEYDMIGMRLVGETTTRKVISIDDAAVRKQFYRRTRPDGTPIDDIEWSLSHIESAAAPLLQNLGDRWPLSFEAKAILAELFSVQLVRGTRWKTGMRRFQSNSSTSSATPKIQQPSPGANKRWRL